jgi:hypothetical protein
MAQEYNLLMQVRGQEITGICVINTTPENEVVGTVVSEFGVKAFDFTYANGKAKVLNVIAMLDKWYIRKVLRKDLAFILENLPQGQDAVKKKRSISFLPNGDIEMKNRRFNIRYTFSPMNHETDQ